MKKLFSILTILASLSITAISFFICSEQAKADGLYNAREELEYMPNARMERQEERIRQIQLQQYQQQQYLQKQKLLNKQSIYNQTHQIPGELAQTWLKDKH